jgi:hypothetical protein
MSWGVKNGAWPSAAPAAGKRRTIMLYFDGTDWVELGRVDNNMP